MGKFQYELWWYKIDVNGKVHTICSMNVDGNLVGKEKYSFYIPTVSSILTLRIFNFELFCL